MGDFQLDSTCQSCLDFHQVWKDFSLLNGCSRNWPLDSCWKVKTPKASSCLLPGCSLWWCSTPMPPPCSSSPPSSPPPPPPPPTSFACPAEIQPEGLWYPSIY